MAESRFYNWLRKRGPNVQHFGTSGTRRLAPRRVLCLWLQQCACYVRCLLIEKQTSCCMLFLEMCSQT